MRRVKIVLCVLFVLMASTHIQGALQSVQIASLALLSSREVLILFSDGSLARTKVDSKELQFIRGPEVLRTGVETAIWDGREVKAVGPYHALGMDVLESEGRTSVYVTGFERQAGGVSLVTFAGFDISDERAEEIWRAKSPTIGQFAGVAVDAQEQRLYVTHTGRGLIYQLSLEEKHLKMKQLARPRGAVVLGALALDGEHRRLFAADVVRGRIHAISLKDSTTTVVAESVGEPVAIAYDSISGRLFVADAGGKGILSGIPDAGDLSSLAPLERSRKPVALAVGTDGRVWVGDASRNEILIFSEESGTEVGVLKLDRLRRKERGSSPQD